MISSLDNAQMKHLISLQKKPKLRKEEKVFLCEGRKMFEEARDMKEPHVQKVYVSQNFLHGLSDDDYFKGIPFEILSDAVFAKVAETITPQGILAIVKQPVHELTDLLQPFKTKLLLLEDIRDPGNLGTMVRTAEGAGFSGIILSKNSVDLFNPKVIRSTMGAILRLPVIYAEDFLQLIRQVKEAGVTVYAAHLQGSSSYETVIYSEQTAILIGNEANGLSDESAALAQHCIRIPMEGKVESLNAGVASAIIMYEVYRQARLSIKYS